MSRPDLGERRPAPDASRLVEPRGRFGWQHGVWILVGLAIGVGGWTAYTPIGAVGLLGGIAAAFIVWRVTHGRGAWVAAVVVGLGLAGLLGWQAVTGSRCPGAGERVELRANSGAATCDELRAGVASMAMFFALIGALGVAWPFYARRLPEASADCGPDDALTD